MPNFYRLNPASQQNSVVDQRQDPLDWLVSTWPELGDCDESLAGLFQSSGSCGGKSTSVIRVQKTPHENFSSWRSLSPPPSLSESDASSADTLRSGETTIDPLPLSGTCWISTNSQSQTSEAARNSSTGCLFHDAKTPNDLSVTNFDSNLATTATWQSIDTIDLDHHMPQRRQMSTVAYSSSSNVNKGFKDDTCNRKRRTTDPSSNTIQFLLPPTRPKQKLRRAWKDKNNKKENQPSQHCQKRKRISRRQEPVDKIYILGSDIRNEDVLFGRGGKSSSHPGNRVYLQHKDMMQSMYLAAARRDKKAISQSLLDFVHDRGGRFLKQEKGERDLWYIVLESAALDKCGQALRDVNTPEVRKWKRIKYAKRENNM